MANSTIADFVCVYRLLIRIRCPDRNVKILFAKKFGCSVLQSYELLDKAKEHGMNVVGVWLVQQSYEIIILQFYH